MSIPQCGGKKTLERQTFEKSPAFKKAQRFRAGIDGRISVLFRGGGMKRCLAHGQQRFEFFFGVNVMAKNLLKIAAARTVGSAIACGRQSSGEKSTRKCVVSAK